VVSAVQKLAKPSSSAQRAAVRPASMPSGWNEAKVIPGGRRRTASGAAVGSVTVGAVIAARYPSHARRGCLSLMGFPRRLAHVTETTIDSTTESTLSELKALVDRGLGGINERRLMPAGEVADLLLDVRMLLQDLESESLVN
jgi:hypothetical protein